MINQDEAESRVLAFGQAESGVALAIQTCERSPRGDYWIIRANSEDFVFGGDRSQMLVGASAYLVRVADGEITVVGSNEAWQTVLQDKYDEAAAGSMHYVLDPIFERNDKTAVVLVRQRLLCSQQTALQLASEERRGWLTGLRRHLLIAQTVIGGKGINTRIVLRHDVDGIPQMDEHVADWNALVARIRSPYEGSK